jgi:thiol:disulfide interchange protein
VPRRATTLLLLALALGLGCGRSTDGALSSPTSAPRPASPKSTKLRWESSWDGAFRRARSENRVVMVEFYADWCVWCKRMESTTFIHPDVVSLLSSRAVPLRVDGEREGRVLAGRYGVQGYPTTVFLAADERELGRVPGYLDAPDFVQTTQGWLGGSRP